MSEISAMMRVYEEDERNARRERTAAATAGRMRASENRGADKLEGRGWACYPPEEAAWVRSLVAAAREKASPR